MNLWIKADEPWYAVSVVVGFFLTTHLTLGLPHKSPFNKINADSQLWCHVYPNVKFNKLNVQKYPISPI
jgi:hypothetical protein